MISKYLHIICQVLRNVFYSRYFLPICLILSIIVRVTWICSFDVTPVSDFAWYYQRGLDIAAGKGYSVNGVPTAYWPVGYPGFLGTLFFTFGNSLLLAKLANVLFYLAIMSLAYSFSKQIFHSEEAARITFLILAFYPNHVVYGSLLASETFFTFLFLFGAFLFVSARDRINWLFISGISWGLATLTKPQAIFVPIAFLLVFFTDIKHLLKSSTMVYLALLLTLLPWLNRNSLIMGKPVLSTNGGINLIIGNNPYSKGAYIWNRELISSLEDKKTEVDRDAKAKQLAIDYVIENPVKSISLWPKKLIHLYRFDREGIYWCLVGMSRPPAKLIVFAIKVVSQLFYLFIVALSLISLPTIIRNGRRYWIGLILIMYFSLIYMVFFGDARFHFPLIPWIAIYSGVGGVVLSRYLLSHKKEFITE